MSSTFATAHSSSSSCSHSTPLTLTSSPLTTSSRPTSQITLSDQNTTAAITRNEDCGPLAKTAPPTGFKPNVTDTSCEFEVFPSFFQRSNVDTICDLGDDNVSPPMPRLTTSTSEMRLETEANLRQTYHSNEESLFEGAQSISASTGQPVAWLTQKTQVKPRVR